MNCHRYIPTLSVVIVTYNRNQVLVDTITSLLAQIKECKEFDELIIIDQTKQHEESVDAALSAWDRGGAIRWIRLPEPNLTGAMNRGLIEANCDIVLYVDDDIIPKQDLLTNHLNAHKTHCDAAAVVGQILQPGEIPESIIYTPKGTHLRRYLDFPFRSKHACYIENAMAGNMSLKRGVALEVGGFDENFHPPVASRFESEFAKRLVKNNNKIWFEPSASINHLAEKCGGTRSKGSYLKSASPIYSVGDYYFAFEAGEGFDKASYILVRPFRQVRTKFHLRHPWWIPVKIIGEIRGLFSAMILKASGKKLLPLFPTDYSK